MAADSEDMLRLRAKARLMLTARVLALIAIFASPVVVQSREEAEALRKSDQATARYKMWTPQQVEAYASTRRNIWTLFGGAKGGGKSVGGARIAQRDISSSRDGIHLVLRRNDTDLKKTTRETYERFFPPELVLSKTEHEWICVNGWRIWFYAADERIDPNFEKIGGMEVTTVHLDEASQTAAKLYEVLPSTLRRDAFDLETDEPIPHYVFATTNPIPGPHWTKEKFISPKTKLGEDHRDAEGNSVGHYFIKSLPDDNAALPASYLKVAFGTMEGPRLRMLRYGDFDVEESDLNIIAPSELRALEKTVTDRTPVAGGGDIGLGRPDASTIWCANAAGEMWCEGRFEEYDTMVQVDLFSPVCECIQANGGLFYIDAGGIGKGVADRLSELYPGTIVSVSFGEAPEPEPDGEQGKRYENRRAQLYFWAREDVQSAVRGQLGGETPDMYVQTTPELIEELENTYHIPQDGKMKLERKAEIRRRIKRSPDDADGFVLCNAARRSAALTSPDSYTTGSSRSAGEPRRRRSSITDGFPR